MPAMPVFQEELTIEIPRNALRFNSKFESGNLNKVIMISENFYVLYLENEPGNPCLQWYYFEVKNKRTQNVTFQIANLGKFESLYNEGMKPLVKSTKEGSQWKRSGSNITYSQNKENNSYSLTFNYNFTHTDDTVYFAYSHPYTYADLLIDLEKIINNHSDIARVDKITESLCGNSLFMITITEDLPNYFSFSEEKYYCRISAAQRNILRKRKIRAGCKNEFVHKKGIFLSSRVHPGETVSSFMMQGAIDFLLSNTRSAQILRKNFIFKLVPMLNPDGVRYGNTRVSLIGADLNRRWQDPNPIIHPCIYTVKKFLKVFSEMHECLLFCDMHGHSIKKNVFFYGCNEKPVEVEQSRKNLIARVIPFLLSKRNKLVSYKDCRFRMEKNKESTARISIFRQFGIVNSLTLEASFYGPSSMEAYSKPRNDLHMLLDDLRSIGKDLCMVLFVYLSPSNYIRTLQNVSRMLRDPIQISKPAVIVQDSGEEENAVYSFKKDIINADGVWDGVEFEYVSEEDSESYASDMDDNNFSEEFKKEEKIDENKTQLKTITPPRLTRRIIKLPKSEKSEIGLSPEAFFKIPGISVFSFNLRAKSSEILSKLAQSRITREKSKITENESKTSKLFILNNENRFQEKAESSRVKFKNFDNIHKNWLNSKSGMLLKRPKTKRVDTKPAQLVHINRYPASTQK